jgi:hypothetical protein
MIATMSAIVAHRPASLGEDPRRMMLRRSPRTLRTLENSALRMFLISSLVIRAKNCGERCCFKDCAGLAVQKADEGG